MEIKEQCVKPLRKHVIFVGCLKPRKAENGIKKNKKGDKIETENGSGSLRTSKNGNKKWRQGWEARRQRNNRGKAAVAA